MFSNFNERGETFKRFVLEENKSLFWVERSMPLFFVIWCFSYDSESLFIARLV
jgi:hypothetical protein